MNEITRTGAEYTDFTVTPLSEIDIRQLADCPWPPSDGHCSYFSIYFQPENQVNFHLWGSYYGDNTRKRFQAQTSFIDISPVKRFTCFISRSKTPSPPEGDGVFIGLVTLDVLNDPTANFVLQGMSKIRFRMCAGFWANVSIDYFNGTIIRT